MAVTILTSKGQITIPQKIRNDMGLTAGDRIAFVRMAEGHYSLVPLTRSIKSLKGIVPVSNRMVSIDYMQEAIAAAATEAVHPVPSVSKQA
ncbi:AbrB family transcriptional regulator [Xaviernesmea oryzae]|uniref:AbrB family transcriptional regulator n=1 Tax=Xaviernesmea oryzae TaxID=464029 RepID=A0A1Q9AW14_9HYPH|nr:AbrB/MazE/SpoVT family DNA-binding domain-containing protein [Xaviernesmea oryzae]OLP59637.1 AbrB family transcriptional regulator [Xaviernesmea oryzae]SEM24328.1 looped-hinge helix DNA binding domain-containing protein, AbrB family [Xaviernesmea oryzae]